MSSDCKKSEPHKWDISSSVVFQKNDDDFGGLSNMANGFSLNINDIPIRTSEALYQMCKFPHDKDAQMRIKEQKSPLIARRVANSKKYNLRPDWENVKVDVMRWCLRVKLAQNWEKFSALLLETGERPIVEKSSDHKSDWAAATFDEQTLFGKNILGCLLMELREAIKESIKKDGSHNSFLSVEPLAIPNFCLMGIPIQQIVVAGAKKENKKQ